MCAAACTFQMPSKWDGSSSPWQSAATLLTQDMHIPCRRYWFQGNMRQTSTNKCCPHMPLYLLHHSRLPTNPARWAQSTIEPQALHQTPLRVSQVCATNVAALGQPLRKTTWKEEKGNCSSAEFGNDLDYLRDLDNCLTDTISPQAACMRSPPSCFLQGVTKDALSSVRICLRFRSGFLPPLFAGHMGVCSQTSWFAWFLSKLLRTRS